MDERERLAQAIYEQWCRDGGGSFPTWVPGDHANPWQARFYALADVARAVIQRDRAVPAGDDDPALWYVARALAEVLSVPPGLEMARVAAELVARARLERTGQPARS